MDTTELAIKMLEYQKLHFQLAHLEEEICAGVIELGRTQEVGLVHVSYSKGRRKLDYHAAGLTASAEIISKNTVHMEEQIIPEQVLPAHDEVDWGAVCKDAGIDPAVVSQEPPSAKITVKEPEKPA